MCYKNSSSFDSLACSNVNSAWGALTIEVLSRLGVETVILSPGSRSTPLTVAAARNRKMESLVFLDERSAAFFALGLAKLTHRPVALVCTSGSAVANYFPAVVEAAMSGTPLLILTADRPPELRACSSGQTIDQLKIFGDYVRAFYEVALPDLRPELLAYLRQTLVHAVNRSLGPDRGPVHLNFPFRDPLGPDPEGAGVVSPDLLEASATVQTRPCELVPTSASVDLVALERLSSHPRGIIIVGDVNPSESVEAFTEAVLSISLALGWPIFSDVLNPLRTHCAADAPLMCHYDAFLRHPASLGDLKPTAILQLGPLPTSKTLRSWLAGLDAVSFLQSDRPVNTDPLHRIATVLSGGLSTLSQAIKGQRTDPRWVESWKQIDGKAAGLLGEALASTEFLFEGKVAWLLSQHLPPKTSVFVASSMSVRYAEYFWMASSRGYLIYANRGANGIDGTLSSALGIAHGGRPAVLLTGDLAFLHDTNGLLAHGLLKGSLTVILINNNGGGIFEHLPIARLEETFEAYFATPQEVSVEKLCAAHGLEHALVNNWAMLVERIKELPRQGVRVLEIRTDRKQDQEYLKTILQAESFHLLSCR